MCPVNKRKKLFTNMSIQIASPESISAKQQWCQNRRSCHWKRPSNRHLEIGEQNKFDNQIKLSHTAIPNHAQTPLDKLRHYICSIVRLPRCRAVCEVSPLMSNISSAVFSWPGQVNKRKYEGATKNRQTGSNCAAPICKLHRGEARKRWSNQSSTGYLTDQRKVKPTAK